MECIDCGEPLVDEWPEEEETEEPKPQAQFVALRSYPSRVYAEMVLEALTQEGIPAVIRSDELYGAGTGLGIGATPTIAIWVPSDQLEEATAIADGLLGAV